MTDPEPVESNRKRKSPISFLLRFRLRTLLLLVTVLGAFVFPELYRQSQQNQAIQELRSSQSVWLEFAQDVESDSAWSSKVPGIRTAVSRQARRFFATGFFDVAVRLYVNVNGVEIAAVRIGKLRYLRWLQIGSAGPGAASSNAPELQPLANCTQLQYLVLGDWLQMQPFGPSGFQGTGVTLFPNAISTADLETIGRLGKLRVLAIGGSTVTDQSLERLAGLKSLQFLYLSRTEVSTAGISRLGELLPGLSIVVMDDPAKDYSIEVPSKF